MKNIKNLGNITLYSEELRVEATNYNDGTQAVVLYDEDGPYATFSVNMEGVVLAPGEFCAKTWSENEDMREPMLASGLFEDTGRRIKQGFIVAEVWRIKNFVI